MNEDRFKSHVYRNELEIMVVYKTPEPASLIRERGEEEWWWTVSILKGERDRRKREQRTRSERSGSRKRSRAFGNRRVSRTNSSIRGWGVGRVIGRPLVWVKQKQGFRKVKRECGRRPRAWGYKCPFEVSMALEVGRGLPEAGGRSSGKRKQGGPVTWCLHHVIFKLLLSSPGIRHFILCLFRSVLKFTSNASGYWSLKKPLFLLKISLSSIPFLWSCIFKGSTNKFLRTPYEKGLCGQVSLENATGNINMSNILDELMKRNFNDFV